MTATSTERADTIRSHEVVWSDKYSPNTYDDLYFPFAMISLCFLGETSDGFQIMEITCDVQFTSDK